MIEQHPRRAASFALAGALTTAANALLRATAPGGRARWQRTAAPSAWAAALVAATVYGDTVSEAARQPGSLVALVCSRFRRHSPG